MVCAIPRCRNQFLPAQVIQAAVDPGIIARPPVPNSVGFVDGAGGAGTDSFTGAAAHEENGTVILDMIYEKTPPFSPSQTVAELAMLFHSYGISTIVGDRFAGEWPVETFAQHNITYEQSKRSRSEIYQAAIPLFTSGRVRLLDNQKLVDQFCNLRRKVQPGGGEQIGHVANAHDDLSNAAAGAIVNALSAEEEHMRVWRLLGQQVEEERETVNIIRHAQEQRQAEANRRLDDKPNPPTTRWVGSVI